jgi:hypothetical protein
MDDSEKKETGSRGEKPQPTPVAPNRIEPSPAIIEFARAPVAEPTSSDVPESKGTELAGAWPVPEELLRDRREWAKTLREKNTKRDGDSHPGNEPGSKAPTDRDPPRR